MATFDGKITDKRQQLARVRVPRQVQTEQSLFNAWKGRLPSPIASFGGERPAVLYVLSADWMSAAEVPRILSEAGATVDVLCPAGAWAQRGSYVDAVFIGPANATAMAEQLRVHLSSRRPYDWVVFGDDPLLAALADRRDEAWLRALLPIAPESPDVALLGSKIGFAYACARHSLPTPRWRVATTPTSGVAAADAIGYPLIAKRDRSSAGNGVFRITHRTELIEKLKSSGKPLLLQEFIDGPIWSVEALFDHGQVVAWASSQIRQTWPTSFGNSTARRFRHAPALGALTQRIGETIRPHGFANITAIETKAGFLLIELDLRTNGLLRLGRRVGVDFAVAAAGLVRRQLGQRPLELAPNADHTIHCFPLDAIRAVGERDVPAMMAWLFGRRRWRSSDPKLDRAYLQYCVGEASKLLLPAGLVSVLGRLRRTLDQH